MPADVAMAVTAELRFFWWSCIVGLDAAGSRPLAKLLSLHEGIERGWASETRSESGERRAGQRCSAIWPQAGPRRRGSQAKQTRNGRKWVVCCTIVTHVFAFTALGQWRRGASGPSRQAQLFWSLQNFNQPDGPNQILFQTYFQTILELCFHDSNFLQNKTAKVCSRPGPRPQTSYHLVHSEPRPAGGAAN